MILKIITVIAYILAALFFVLVDLPLLIACYCAKHGLSGLKEKIFGKEENTNA